MNHSIAISFLFALGACVGSFLNVVVWRLPRGQSIVTPPSKCPKCGKKLAWYDNLPIIGWIKLGGRCRYCHEPISPRYPIVETITACLFVLYYVCFFVWQIGPCPMVGARRVTLSILIDWPIYFLYMFTVSALLAASLIDAELYIIPPVIPWTIAIVGVVVHAIVDSPTLPGNLLVGPAGLALSFGAGIGLCISLLLLRLKIFKISFEHGEPMLDIDRELMMAEKAKAKREGRDIAEFQIPPSYTRGKIRLEIGKEMIFLMPPLLLGAFSVFLMITSPGVQKLWTTLERYYWVNGLLGAILGAMIGAFVVWLTRILGTLGFGRVAMGLGDVDLMFGVGAVIGPWAAIITFFIAPFLGIFVAAPNVAMRLIRKIRHLLKKLMPRGIYRILAGLIRRFSMRELPFGPYLSLAAAVVMIFYCDIAHYLQPGLEGLMFMLQRLFA